ncbi:MAG: hypothetical protein IPO63_10680 [Bacteroidetes bacterium]|nr:hypothetical protein [Bacteroidota bacterium]
MVWESGKLKAEVFFWEDQLKGKGLSYYESGKVLAERQLLRGFEKGFYLDFHGENDSKKSLLKFTKRRGHRGMEGVYEIDGNIGGN